MGALDFIVQVQTAYLNLTYIAFWLRYTSLIPNIWQLDSLASIVQVVDGGDEVTSSAWQLTNLRARLSTTQCNCIRGVHVSIT